MRSYSQYGEDTKALEVLERWEIAGGCVLELGAWHPIDKSNSRLFIDIGWNAVLVDPSPAAIGALAREYNEFPKVTVCGFPVTVHGGVIRMILSDDALSGETIQEEWRKEGGYYGWASMLSMSMAEFLRTVCGDFQVCSIDVEGQSVDLFAEMMRVGPRPRVVILEHNARHVELAQIAEAANYRQVHLNGTNVILEWQGPR